jgi:hypothetical protein
MVMDFQTVQTNQVSTMATETQNGGQSQTDDKKKKRMETLNYLKAHFDIIAVSLTIVFLGYSIYNIQKNVKSK